MSKTRTVFRILRAVGLLSLLALILRSEWMFFNGDPSNALNWKIQFFAIVSILIVPFAWVPLVFIVVGHVGKWQIDRRLKKGAAEEQAT